MAELAFLSVIFSKVIPFIIILSILVFFHEFGHFIVARWVGVKVQTFSIGFGRPILSWTDRHETKWAIGWAPLGGYVKMYGDANAASTPQSGSELSEMSEAEKAVSFPHKKLWQRASVIAAGPIANFILAIIIFTALFAVIGQTKTAPIVGGVLPNSVAEQAGIVSGDKIISVHGTKIDRFEDIQNIVTLRPEESLEFVINRQDRILTMTLIPERLEIISNDGVPHMIGRIGVQASELREYQRLSLPNAFVQSFVETTNVIENTLVGLRQIIVGTRPVDELGGPILIASMSGTVWKLGVTQVLYFMAFLSISIGILNLLPIPMLDGGHLFFYLIEAVTQRPVGEKFQQAAHVIGLVFLVSLMIFVIFNDIRLMLG